MSKLQNCSEISNTFTFANPIKRTSSTSFKNPLPLPTSVPVLHSPKNLSSLQRINPLILQDIQKSRMSSLLSIESRECEDFGSNNNPESNSESVNVVKGEIKGREEMSGKEEVSGKEMCDYENLYNLSVELSNEIQIIKQKYQMQIRQKDGRVQQLQRQNKQLKQLLGQYMDLPIYSQSNNQPLPDLPSLSQHPSNKEQTFCDYQLFNETIDSLQKQIQIKTKQILDLKEKHIRQMSQKVQKQEKLDLETQNIADSILKEIRLLGEDCSDVMSDNEEKQKREDYNLEDFLGQEIRKLDENTEDSNKNQCQGHGEKEVERLKSVVEKQRVDLGNLEFRLELEGKIHKQMRDECERFKNRVEELERLKTETLRKRGESQKHNSSASP